MLFQKGNQYRFQKGNKYGALTKKHGLSEKFEYMSWIRMLTRIRHSDKANDTLNKIYTVCTGDNDHRWEKFENFHADMSQTWRKGLEIDRIQWWRGYNKDNCRWVTHEDNLKNKHVWTAYDFRFLIEKRGALVAYLTFKERFDWEMSHKCKRYIICRWKNGRNSKYYLPESESWEGIYAFFNEFYIAMIVDRVKEAPRHLHAIVDLIREEERRKRLKRGR